MKTKNSPTKKVPLLYGEKFLFCSGVLQNSLHLVYISFHDSKKYPSIIRWKIQVLLMCFERKFTNYFIKTKILTVFIDEDSLPVALFLQLTKKFVLVVEIWYTCICIIVSIRWYKTYRYIKLIVWFAEKAGKIVLWKNMIISLREIFFISCCVEDK